MARTKESQENVSKSIEVIGENPQKGKKVKLDLEPIIIDKAKVEILRSRSQTYRNKANISLSLIICFIGVAVYIFYNASFLSNVQTQSLEINKLKNQRTVDSLNNLYLKRVDSLKIRNQYLK
jgi:hypothetical protein